MSMQALDVLIDEVGTSFVRDIVATASSCVFDQYLQQEARWQLVTNLLHFLLEW